MRHAFFLAVLGGPVLLLALPNRAVSEPDGAWGAIKGQVIFGGDQLPTPQALDVNKDKEHCLAQGKIFREEWVIDKDSKGVKWVFVWLAPPAGKKLPIHPSLKEPKEKQVTVDQPCCAFVPHALALRQGQELLVKNSSPIPHNVKWTGFPPFNESGNVIVPPGKSHTITGLRPQKVALPIECNIHPWMKGWARVFPHPYFALTDAKGNFEIKDAPAGDWQVIMWHESAGWVAGKDGKKVAVKAGAATDLGKVPAKP